MLFFLEQIGLGFLGNIQQMLCFGLCFVGCVAGAGKGLRFFAKLIGEGVGLLELLGELFGPLVLCGFGLGFLNQIGCQRFVVL